MGPSPPGCKASRLKVVRQSYAAKDRHTAKHHNYNIDLQNAVTSMNGKHAQRRGCFPGCDCDIIRKDGSGDPARGSMWMDRIWGVRGLSSGARKFIMAEDDETSSTLTNKQVRGKASSRGGKDERVMQSIPTRPDRRGICGEQCLC